MHGLRVRLVHGHRLKLQAGLEGMDGEPELPPDVSGAARSRGVLLDRRLRLRNERRRLGAPSAGTTRASASTPQAAAARPTWSLIGHVHTPLDAAESNPRLIVPGGWHEQSSYVKVDDSGAALFVETDDALIRGDRLR